MQKVLLVDDDPHILEVLQFALKTAGFAIDQARDGTQALERFRADRPDLVVLDVSLPELDGYDVCRSLRREAATPIVFLSSRTEELDRILALELGGDDYVLKPFSPRELVARIKAVLRRAAAPAVPVEKPRVMAHGPLKLDEDLFKAFWEQQEIVLTATEFELLRALMGHPGKVYRRDELIDRAYGGEVVVSDRTIDSHVRRLRQKIAAAGGDPIETVHGVGYRLAV
ncbi:MAG TPA: response regulator transcription factor [Myxococcales bacterium]|nr:response regulator transcription factor [Myxococcales bacterium]